jgi:hypothetical protein
VSGCESDNRRKARRGSSETNAVTLSREGHKMIIPPLLRKIDFAVPVSGDG